MGYHPSETQPHGFNIDHSGPMWVTILDLDKQYSSVE